MGTKMRMAAGIAGVLGALGFPGTAAAAAHLATGLAC